MKAIKYLFMGALMTVFSGSAMAQTSVKDAVNAIKTNKDKAAEAARTSGSGYRPAPEEPPTDRTEPPDVGI